MDILDRLKKISYFNFINFYKQSLLKIFFYFNNKKKKEILRNSILSNFLLKKFFRDLLNFERLRTIFFNKNIFAYSNDAEKEEIIKQLNNNHSEQIKQYIEMAERVINKEFSVFDKNYLFKNRINWNYGFFNNFYWELKNSEKIDLYPKDVEVDVKYVWEFNRHHFLFYLGFAYYYTGNEKYAIEYKQLIMDWIRKNPPLFGINWFSGLEISIRTCSWICSLFFFKNSKEINNDEFFGIIFKSLFEHSYYLKYFHIKRSLNHTIGDIFGICLFSKIFEEIKPIKRWKKKFFKKFISQIELQVRIDGTNIEQSTNYHRFVLEFFFLFSLINPEVLNNREKYLIEKMFDYFLYIIKPNGNIPIIGDNDDGKVILLNNTNDNFKILVNLGAIIFKRADLKFICQKLHILPILLLGQYAFETFHSIEVQEPLQKWKFFETAGYFVIRNRWDNKANYLFMDCGRFGAFKGAHSHSSITNIIYSYNGSDILIDSGTSSYNLSLNERNLFRSSQAHNVLSINYDNQAEFKSYFAWENLPKIKRIIKKDNSHIELTCYHNGYKEYLVKRKVIVNEEVNNIIIEDSIFPTEKNTPKKSTNINIYFHFNEETKLRLEEKGLIINDNLLLVITSDQEIKLNIEKGLYSPHYGFKCENKVLNISSNYDFKDANTILIRSEFKSLE